MANYGRCAAHIAALLLLAAATVNEVFGYELQQSTGTTWAYMDQGIDLALTDWESWSFDDSAWPTGPSLFGYGVTGAATTVSFGPVSSAKYITTYFRRRFTLEVPPSQLTTTVVGLCAADGGVMYLNGVEIARKNMGTPVAFMYGDLALAALTAPANVQFTYYSFPSSLLVQGENLLAVEVHLAGKSSPALAFDGYLMLNDWQSIPVLIGSPFAQTINKAETELRYYTNIPSMTRGYTSQTMGSAPLTILRSSNAADSNYHSLPCTNLQTGAAVARNVMLILCFFSRMV